MYSLSNTVQKLLTPIAKTVLLTWERLESGVSYDITSQAVIADPYPLYQRLRSKDPIHRLRLINAWALTRYQDAEAVLLDHKRFSSGENRFDYTPYRTMLDLDPPDHTRLRALVSKAFTPRSVAALAPRIQQIADELLDAAADQDRFDLMHNFAFPLPVIVIAEMLGIPPQDRDQFIKWSDAIALSIEPILTDQQIAQVLLSTEELFAYFEGIIEQRQKKPQDDLLSALLAAEEQGDKLDREELLSTLMLLLVAGNETTRNLIGNGMLALLRNPDQIERLRDNPDLMESALHELLRYDSPVQFNIRVVRQNMEFKGKRLRAGQRIVVLVGAANRDPAVFPDPDVLDIGRQDKSHISFGRGIHYCLGAPLAMLEGRIAFAALLKRFPSMRLLSVPKPKHQVVLRGVESLWIEVERS